MQILRHFWICSHKIKIVHTSGLYLFMSRSITVHNIIFGGHIRKYVEDVACLLSVHTVDGMAVKISVKWFVIDIKCGRARDNLN